MSAAVVGGSSPRPTTEPSRSATASGRRETAASLGDASLGDASLGDASFDEMKAGLELASPLQTARLFGRAFLLRCPHCSGGPVLRHWLAMRVRCGRCGLRIERGEHDYFIGSIFILFTLAGILVLGTLVVTLVASWPEVPWELLQYGLPVMMALAMPALYPFSKLVWLAFDLMLRPVTPEELEWHRSAERTFSSVRDASRD